MNKVILSVTNDLTYDQRVHKICGTLEKIGYNVTLVGRKQGNSKTLEKRTYQLKRFGILPSSGALFYAFYNVRLFWFLLFAKCDVFISNDADTLLANFIVSRLRNKPLIFDSHELFSEVPEIQNKPIIKGVWRWIEDTIIPQIKYAYTVCDSIADYYADKYKTKFEVIRNLPKQKEVPLGVQHKQDLILYQGSVNMGRGLEKLIEAMAILPQYKLLIVGDGDILPDLLELVNSFGLQDRVGFTGGIPFDELYEITWTASIGVSLEQDLGLNYQFALPNKIFDYLQAEIPFIGSDLIEISKIIDHYGVGIKVPSNCNHKELAQNIDGLFRSKHNYKENIQKAKRELNWEKEEIRYIQMFKNWKL